MKTQHIQWMTMIALVFVLTGCPLTSDKKPTDTQPVTQILTAEEKAIEKIKAYATSNGTSDTPTLQDYIDAKVTGIDDANLADINQVVENLIANEVDSKEELQALANALGINIDTIAPVFTSSASASVNENQTSAITLVATDVNTVTYSISGVDAANFSVNGGTGVVTFNTAPDFEVKNSYAFMATATDEAANSISQAISIIILDIQESIDADGDNHTIPSDCNDNNASIHPGAIEIFNDRIDNNCNNEIDESILTPLHGNWISNFSQPTTIDVPNTYLITSADGTLTNLWHFISVNNSQRYFIYQYDKNNAFNPNLYGKTYITVPAADKSFYICSSIFDAASEQEAEDDPIVPNSTNPENSGCGNGNFRWTKIIFVP